MKLISRPLFASLLSTAAVFAPAMAVAQLPTLTLTYIPGSSAKVYQINGDCDWVEWDATISSAHPTCVPTYSQTISRGDIVGDDVANSFESNGQLVMTFGDTIGADSDYSPMWTTVSNSFDWAAHDPIGFSTTRRAEDGLTINFPLVDGHALEVLPTDQQPGNEPVAMGPDDVPDGGINLYGQVFLSAKTGTTTDSMGNHDQSADYNVLVAYDESTQTFNSGRTISSSPNGHFVTTAFYQLPIEDFQDWAPGSHPGDVAIFGLGLYRGSNVYLSMIPAASFWSGVDSLGNPATRYLSGWNNGWPKWSQSESDAVPIVTDLDPANPTIGNLSAFYSPELGLWLMTFDSFYGAAVANHGAYFTYARHPWGPWAKPQLIFNSCRDHGLGYFMRYYYNSTTIGNFCPAAMPPGNTATVGSAGPAGPTIALSQHDPDTTSGGEYAPLMIERFTRVEGDKLKIFYTLSTWNPYAVVLMESDFTIGLDIDGQ